MIMIAWLWGFFLGTMLFRYPQSTGTVHHNEKNSLPFISYYREFSRITNMPGLVVQQNQTLQLMEALQTRPDNLGKRL